jgi:hypothetical protein
MLVEPQGAGLKRSAPDCLQVESEDRTSTCWRGRTPTSPDIARYEKNLKEELDGSALYAALAAAEVDPTRKDLFLQLSQAEAGHAQLWREKLTAAGVDAERFTPSLRTRILARLAQRFGPRFVLPAIAATEFADRDKYAGQDTLAREELGIDPAELGGNPWSAAAFSFALFALGAFFPVVPFFFAGGMTGIAWSLALSVAALGAIGLATSLFSVRGPVYSATRQVLVGAIAAAVTYATGAMIGVSLS